MIKTKLFMATFLALSLLAPQASIAGKGNTNFLKGKPFGYLDGQNKSYADAIAALQAEMQEMAGQLDNVATDIDNLSTTVHSYSASIEGLNSDVSNLRDDLSANQQDIDDLNAALQQLTNQHDADLALVNQAIQDINANIDALHQQVNALTVSLNAELNALQQAVAANSSDISLLLVNVTSILGQIANLNNNLSLSENRLDDLETAVNDINAELASLQSTVDNLVPPASALEQSGLPKLVYSGDFIEGVAVDANSPESMGWINFRNNAIGSFTSIEIKNSLGGSVVCSDPNATTDIAQALHTKALSESISSFNCDGQAWNVGACGAEIELNAGANTDLVCSCNQAASVRPRISLNNVNWGGVGADFGGSGRTCRAPTQTLEVILTR